MNKTNVKLHEDKVYKTVTECVLLHNKILQLVFLFLYNISSAKAVI